MAYYGIQNGNFNSSLSFGQAAFTFRLPRTISCSSWIMILLENDLPGPLTIEQVSFKSYLPSKKIYLSETTGQDFFLVLMKWTLRVNSRSSAVTITLLSYHLIYKDVVIWNYCKDFQKLYL